MNARDITISGGRVIGFCPRCDKPVRLDKPLLGGLHFCVSDCALAGEHLDLRTEVRGYLWWKSEWRVCGKCGREQRVEP